MKNEALLWLEKIGKFLVTADTKRHELTELQNAFPSVKEKKFITTGILL